MWTINAARVGLVGLALALPACGGSSGTTDPVPGFTVEKSTIALWHLNEGSGQTAYDASPNGYDLRLGNEPGDDTRDPTWVGAGHLGACLAFEVSRDDYTIAPRAITLPTNQLSIELWHRTVLPTGRLFELETDVVLLNWTGSSLSFLIDDGTVEHAALLLKASVLATLTDGSWHYIAATYDGNVMRIYVDGQEEASLVASPTIPPATALVVGGRTGGSDTIEGEIDEVRISARAIGADEIAAHWATGSP